MKAVARKVCDNAKEILDDVLSQQSPPQAEPLASSSASIPTPTTLPLGASPNATAAAAAGTVGEEMFVWLGKYFTLQLKLRTTTWLVSIGN